MLLDRAIIYNLIHVSQGFCELKFTSIIFSATLLAAITQDNYIPVILH